MTRAARSMSLSLANTAVKTLMIATVAKSVTDQRMNASVRTTMNKYTFTKENGNRVSVNANNLTAAREKACVVGVPHNFIREPLTNDIARPVVVEPSREYDAAAAHIVALEAAYNLMHSALIKEKDQRRALEAELAECKPCNCWRKGNVLPRGERMPMTLQTLQDAWDRDQELICDQDAEISKLKQRINKLDQANKSINNEETT